VSIQLRSQFHTTAWDLVRRAGDRGSDEGLAALDELCRRYWYPLYAYLRRRGHSADDAADVVQGFFATILHRDGVARVEQRLGRFRTWLLSSLQNYLVDQERRATTQRRGGGIRPVSLDVDVAERRYQLEPADDLEPEQLFSRRWALNVLERAREGLRSEYVARRQGELFDALQPELFDGRRPDPATVARLGLSPTALRVARHRLRKGFAERVRREARTTLGEGLDPDEELRELIAALAPPPERRL
jgi:RNA polymerase sigma-70 factor (ECF subfamily)